MKSNHNEWAAVRRAGLAFGTDTNFPPRGVVDPCDTADESTAGGATPTFREPVAVGFRLVFVEGPQVGRTWVATSAPGCSIGAHSSNRVVIEDKTVSQFHCEIEVGDGSLRLRDLGSKNGTAVDGVKIVDAFLRGGSVIRVGRTAMQLLIGDPQIALRPSERSEFGHLVGDTGVMRLVFALLQQVAGSDVTVLLEGETGTGKDLAAQGLHDESPRRTGPFVVVDCGTLPRELMESELFGHERGAFTGAIARRTGAFEEANGGTILLDEIGELPLELQPKLLRVLERREIRRVGSNGYQPIDVRVIAATNRDLQSLVNLGAFRADLYFRLAVVRIVFPPLRSRAEDIPRLARHLLQRMGAPPEMLLATITPEFLHELSRYPWPGNVRELRNHLERCLVFGGPLSIAAPLDAISTPRSWRYSEARGRALREFEQDYISKLVDRHEGRVADAAMEAGVDRVYIYRLMRRHGLGRRPPGT